MATVDEAAGGDDALLRLAQAWHTRVLHDYVAWATTTTMARYHGSTADAGWAGRPALVRERRAALGDVPSG